MQNMIFLSAQTMIQLLRLHHFGSIFSLHFRQDINSVIITLARNSKHLLFRNLSTLNNINKKISDQLEVNEISDSSNLNRGH